MKPPRPPAGGWRRWGNGEAPDRAESGNASRDQGLGEILPRTRNGPGHGNRAAHGRERRGRGERRPPGGTPAAEDRFFSASNGLPSPRRIIPERIGAAIEPIRSV